MYRKQYTNRKENHEARKRNETKWRGGKVKKKGNDREKDCDGIKGKGEAKKDKCERKGDRKGEERKN